MTVRTNIPDYYLTKRRNKQVHITVQCHSELKSQRASTAIASDGLSRKANKSHMPISSSFTFISNNLFSGNFDLT